MSPEELAAQHNLSLKETVDSLLCGSVRMAGYMKNAPAREAALTGTFEEHYDMPDIRASKKDRDLNETGADGLFCNDMSCLKQKDEIMTLSGMRNYDDEIGDLLTKLGREYRAVHEEIADCHKRLKQKELLLEALAVRLGYDNVTFNENGVKMTRDKMIFDFPPAWDRRR